MHELPVTESILEITLRHAREAQASKVTDLYLVIGDLSSIVDDSIQFYWDILSKGTPAEGATLHFKRIPAELYCFDCQKSYSPEAGELRCPDCNGAWVEVRSGEEFFLESIAVDEVAPRQPNKVKR